MDKKKIDMLSGSIWDKIILFALPLAASSILQQLFNSADIAIVGNYAGNHALAAVGANSPIINLLVNLFVGLSVGANVVIATFIGERNQKRTSAAVQTSIVLSIISGFILLVIGLVFARPILELISTPEEIIGLAQNYLRIYFMGMPFIMLYNFAAAIMRSNGDTKRPLIALLVSGVVNVCLNLFFVVVCHMNVEGVAIATVLANVISSLMLVYFLVKDQGIIHLDLHSLHVNKLILIRIAKIGLPAGLQGTVFSISNVCIQSATNGLGANAIAGSAAALNYEYFAYFIVSAFGQTAVSFIGQNYGAKNYQRCKDITKWSFILGMAATLSSSFLFVFFREPLIGIFTSDVQVAQFAYDKVLFIISFEFLNFIIELLSGCLRGIGYSSVPAIICVAGICGIRVIYVYLIYPSIASFNNLMMIYPISWSITVTVLIFVYFFVQKRAYKIAV